MSSTTQSRPRAAIIAELYARHRPDLDAQAFPPEYQQALTLLGHLVGQVTAADIAPQRWGEREFIWVFSSQIAVRQTVARLQGLPLEAVGPRAVRHILGLLGRCSWEHLAPDLAYPAETPDAASRGGFRKALELQLASGSQPWLDDAGRALLASLVDDWALRDQQGTWLTALRSEPSPLAVLGARIALLPQLQRAMAQVFEGLPRLASLADFDQVLIHPADTANPSKQSLAALVLASLTEVQAFTATEAYGLVDLRGGSGQAAQMFTGAALDAFSRMVHALGQNLRESDLPPLADTLCRRLQRLARLACSEGRIDAGEFQRLEAIRTLRDAAILHDRGDIEVALAGIDTADGERHPLLGTLVITAGADARVLLLTPHRGIEAFADLEALTAELQRQFNEPGLLQPWLAFVPAQARAAVIFSRPAANRLFRQRLLRGDVFAQQAQDTLARLRGDLAEACQRAGESRAPGSLAELGACILNRLDADRRWLAEALEQRTLDAVTRLDLHWLLQACHLQLDPGAALPLQGHCEDVTVARLFASYPAPEQPEPVSDEVHGEILRRYLATDEVAHTMLGILDELPDKYPPPAKALPALARALVRRLRTAPAATGEYRGRRFSVFHCMATLRQRGGQAGAQERLIASAWLDAQVPPDSAFTCGDWIDAQLVTRDWRREVVHRHIGGGAAMPDLQALWNTLQAAGAYDYTGISPDRLADEVNPLLDVIVDGPAFQRLEQMLLKPARWPAETPPERRQALALAAITDYLYPVEAQRAGYLCGFNLYDPGLGDQRWQQVGEALWLHLRRHFRGHSAPAVSLAAALLLRRHAPAFLVRGIAPSLFYGHTQDAVDFRHAVALAEATFPGLAWRMRFAELETLCKDTLEGATTEAQQVACAALRSDPSIYFALCRGRLKARGLDEVSDDQARQAIEFANEDAQRRERDLNVLLEPAPDRLEMARRQLLIDAPGLDQDRKVKMKETEKSRLNSVRIKYLESVNSLVRKPFTQVMSNLERYMTDVDGYGFTDEELGFDSKGAGGAALSRRFDEAYDRFEQAHRAALVRRLVDGIQDLPAIQREQLMAARHVVTVNFKDQEGGFDQVGHFGVLALGDGYAFELFCPSGTVRKVVLDSGPDVQRLRYRSISSLRIPADQFAGLPRLDLSAYTEGRSGSATERAGKLQYLFSLIPRTVPPAQYVETLCKRLVDEHFGKVISQMRGFWRRETAYESYCRQSHEGLDTPLGFIVPFYSIYLDIKNKQVGAGTLVFGALELISFLLPFPLAFKSGYTASMTLGKVVARTTSFGVSNVALRLAKGGVAGRAFTRAWLAGTLQALNPVPIGLLALLAKAGWKGVGVLAEALWRLRQVHPHLDSVHALAAEWVRYTGVSGGTLGHARLLKLPQGASDAVARGFRADFSWGNHRLSVAQQMQLHARDVDLSQAEQADHLYRLDESYYIQLQGNVYAVRRTDEGHWQLHRGQLEGPRVEYAGSPGQWRVVHGGLAGGMSDSWSPTPSTARQVRLPMTGIEGEAPDYHVQIAGQPVAVVYDVHEGGWRVRRNDLLGPMVWRDLDNQWRMGSILDFRTRTAALEPPDSLRRVELPPLPALPLQLEPVPSTLHYLWIGRQPPERQALLNMTANAQHAAGFESILHVDVDAQTLERLRADAAELTVGLQIRDLNDEHFFRNLQNTPLGEQYRHIIGAAEPYYPGASQLLRYPLLNAYGGVYLDVDNVLLEPLQAGDLNSRADQLLLGTWVESPLVCGYGQGCFASRADNPLLQAISARMSQRYVRGRQHYDSTAPRQSGRQVLAFYRTHARLTGMTLFNDVLAQFPNGPGLPQLDLMRQLGVYDLAYERAAYRSSLQQFPFANLRMVQATRMPNWQRETARLAGPLSEPALREQLHEFQVPDDPAAALVTLRDQGRSDEAITRMLATLAFQRAQMRQAIDQWLAVLFFAPGGCTPTHLDMGERLMGYWLTSVWSGELNRPRLALSLGSMSIESLPPLPAFFYPLVWGLDLGPQVRWLIPQHLSRFANLISLEVDCTGNTGLLLPSAQQVPRLVHLGLRNLDDAARHLTGMRRITTLRSLDLTGARGLAGRDELLDLSGFTLHSIVLDRCRLIVFPRGDFSLTERLSLADNQLRTVPTNLLINPVTSRRATEIVLWGNPLPVQVQLRMLFATGEGRSYRFIFDDSRLSAIQRRRVEIWHAESTQIREAFDEWVNGNGTSQPLPEDTRAAREDLGLMLLEAHRQFRSSGMGAPLTLLDLAETPPFNLPIPAYQAIHHLELRSPRLDGHELRRFVRPFSALRSLTVSNYSAGPGELLEILPNLSELSWLELLNVGLVVDQRAMDLFAAINQLMHLNLSHNRLGSIDDASALAARFDANAGLVLSHMQIEHIPPWMDSDFLDSLEELDLAHNRLTQIPEDLFSNDVISDVSTDVSLEGNPLDPALALRLLDSVNTAQMHGGPRFTFDIDEPVGAHGHAYQGTAPFVGIEPWLVGLEPPQAASRRQLWEGLVQQAQVPHLLTMIDQLRQTADFRHSQRRAELIDSVWTVLEQAEGNEIFRQRLNAMAEEGARLRATGETCSDGLRIEFARIESEVTTWRAVPPDLPAEQRGAYLYRLLRSRYRADAVEILANRQARGRDVAGVRMAYWIGTRQDLELQGGPRGMVYPGSAQLRAGELSAVIVQVLEGERLGGLLDYTQMQPFWTDYLRERYSGRFASLEAAYRQRVLDVDDHFPTDSAQERTARLEQMVRDHENDQQALIRDLTEEEGSTHQPSM